MLCRKSFSDSENAKIIYFSVLILFVVLESLSSFNFLLFIMVEFLSSFKFSKDLKRQILPNLRLKLHILCAILSDILDDYCKQYQLMHSVYGGLECR